MHILEVLCQLPRGGWCNRCEGRVKQMLALRHLQRSCWYNRCGGGVKQTLALRHLPRSGWSFGRAGLGAKATYPA